MHKQFPHLRPGDNSLVEFDVERPTAGKSQPAGLPDDIAQVVIHQVQAYVLEQLLHCSGVVDVGLVGGIILPRGSQPVDQPG